MSLIIPRRVPILRSRFTSSVSTLVLLADTEGEKRDFATVLWGQVKSLRDQLDKDPEHIQRASQYKPFSWPTPPQVLQKRTSHAGGFGPRAAPRWRTDMNCANPNMTMPGEFNSGNPVGDSRLGRDMRNMALAAAAMGRSFIA